MLTSKNGMESTTQMALSLQLSCALVWSWGEVMVEGEHLVRSDLNARLPVFYCDHLAL